MCFMAVYWFFVKLSVIFRHKIGSYVELGAFLCLNDS